MSKKNVMNHYNQTIISAVSDTLSCLNEEFYEDALALIQKSHQRGGRVHVTGIGKPSYIAGYIASLLSSVGTPAYFLDGTEAVHGSSGQVMSGDVVIAISNSGETQELLATAATLKNNGASLIAVCSNETSSLAKMADVHLKASVEDEGGPLNKAPRASVLSAMIVLQGLSILLQYQQKLTLETYKKYHPGGALGASIK